MRIGTHCKLPRVNWDSIPDRWPLLLDAMKWVACLSDTEAIACLRDYAQGYTYSSEAVNHFGGPIRVIERAIVTRASAAVQRRDIQQAMRRMGPTRG